jgi:DNA-binding NtrC family response regulator
MTDQGRADGAGRPHRVLIADDCETTRRQFRFLLEEGGAFAVDAVADGRAALEALTAQPYSLFLTDLRMPQLDGLQLVAEVHRHKIPVTVIVLTGHGSIDQAVQAMRLGAYDFLAKPVDLDHLRVVLDRALRERRLNDEVATLREQLRSQHRFRNLLSKSPRMHAVFELIQYVADAGTTVLIGGETGTGKEQVARAIHQASAAYRPGPFVAVNCAALPETLLESELFGHEKGSFTGATGQRKGRFEQAHKGTLFLDEVGDVPMSMQVKLLRVLQERRFERVGGTEPIDIDVRVVAATNRPLEQMVEEGKFRQDLFYRLNVVRIELPPLRDRPEDIPLLVAHFCQKFARPGQPPAQVSPETMERLLQYTWPGNVRQLENAVRRFLIMPDLNHAMTELQRPGPHPEAEPSPAARREKRSLKELSAIAAERAEKEVVLRTLEEVNWNRKQAARQLNICYKSLLNKLRRWQLGSRLDPEQDQAEREHAVAADGGM